MPELPEVEVTRRGIDMPLRGAQVLALRLGKPLRWPLGCEPASVAGLVVGPVQRRGKYLWLPLLVREDAVRCDAAVPAGHASGSTAARSARSRRA